MDFSQVATFSSRLEAETVAHALDKYRIPYMIKSDDIGLFGSGSSGPTPQGASLYVPEDEVDKTRDALKGLLEKPSGK